MVLFFNMFVTCQVCVSSWSFNIDAEQYFSTKSKFSHQVIKMFAFVIATFLTCWFPYHAYFVYSYHNPEVELPILSDYSFVFVILFVIDTLHHPGSPIYHFVYSIHNPEVVLSFSSIELPSNLSCCFSLVMSCCHCVCHFHA